MSYSREQEYHAIVGVLIDPPGVEVEPHNIPPNDYYLMRMPDAHLFHSDRYFRVVTVKYDGDFLEYFAMKWWLNDLMNDSEIAKEQHECL